MDNLPQQHKQNSNQRQGGLGQAPGKINITVLCNLDTRELEFNQSCDSNIPFKDLVTFLQQTVFAQVMEYKYKKPIEYTHGRQLISDSESRTLIELGVRDGDTIMMKMKIKRKFKDRQQNQNQFYDQNQQNIEEVEKLLTIKQCQQQILGQAPGKINITVISNLDSRELEFNQSCDSNIPFKDLVTFFQQTVIAQQMEPNHYKYIEYTIGRQLISDSDSRTLIELGVRDGDTIMMKIKRKFKDRQQNQNQFYDQNQQNIEEIEKLITISNFNKQSQSNANNKSNQIISSHKYQIIGNAINRAIAEKSQYNKLQDPRDYLISQNLDDNNLELLLYVLSDQLGQSNIKLYHTKEKDDLSMYSLQTSFAKDCYQASCLQLRLQETPDLRFDDLSNNQQLGDRFTQEIKEIISKSYQVLNEEVEILSIEKGSIIINFKVNEIKDDVTSTIILLAEVDKKFPKSKATLELHPFIKQMMLSPNDFDHRGNMEWQKNHKEWEERGPRGDKMKYWFPRGWMGFGLNVKDKYDDGNQDWLLMNGNPNQWHIMFHGTNSLGCKGIVQGGFKIGCGQQYKDQYCLRTKQLIGEGIYFSNHIEVCEEYSRHKGTKIWDKEFYLVFQSRVKPQALKQIKKKSDVKGKDGNPDWDNDYFLVHQVEDIRPYRILLLKKGK